MPMVDLFTKRPKCIRDDVPTEFQYDKIPAELREQVVLILNDAFGQPEYNSVLDSRAYFNGAPAYELIHKTLLCEIPLSYFQAVTRTPYHSVINFVLNTEVTDRATDPELRGLPCFDISTWGS